MVGGGAASGGVSRSRARGYSYWNNLGKAGGEAGERRWEEGASAEPPMVDGSGCRPRSTAAAGGSREPGRRFVSAGRELVTVAADGRRQSLPPTAGGGRPWLPRRGQGRGCRGRSLRPCRQGPGRAGSRRWGCAWRSRRSSRARTGSGCGGCRRRWPVRSRWWRPRWCWAWSGCSGQRWHLRPRRPPRRGWRR